MSVIYNARVTLIRIGKILPFIICGIVLLSYIETLMALITSNFSLWDNNIIPEDRFSWFIGGYFEYDFITLVIIIIISIAIETCYWNKLSILYLFIQLGEKSYFATIELYEEYIYMITIANIIISGFFVWKGISIFINNK